MSFFFNWSSCRIDVRIVLLQVRLSSLSHFQTNKLNITQSVVSLGMNVHKLDRDDASVNIYIYIYMRGAQVDRGVDGCVGPSTRHGRSALVLSTALMHVS